LLWFYSATVRLGSPTMPRRLIDLSVPLENTVEIRAVAMLDAAA
jgi:hypothetical protein